MANGKGTLPNQWWNGPEADTYQQEGVCDLMLAQLQNHYLESQGPGEINGAIQVSKEQSLSKGSQDLISSRVNAFNANI